MTRIEFIYAVKRHLGLIVFAGITAAALTFFFTKNTKKEYTSEALINTGLVSGYSIESSKGGRVDYAYTNNEIQNLISLASSYETMEGLATELLVQYLLLTEEDSMMMLSSNFQVMRRAFSQPFWKKLTDIGSYAETMDKVLEYRNQTQANPINEIIYSTHDYFGIEQLETLQITRERNSDMIRFKYTTSDPGVCRQTVATLIDIFIRKQKAVKKGQSSDVLAFFEKATRESAAQLKEKEDELLQFMVRNKIINYYEQTRFIAAKKEDLDELYFKEKMKLAAADSALSRVKNELSNRIEMPELNEDLLSKQKEMTQLSAKLARFESIKNDTIAYDEQIELVRNQIIAKEQELRRTAEASFAVQRTPEGAELKDLLFQWLNQALESEQSAARLQVFMERKKEFDKTYKRFAPWGSKLKRIEREIDVAERAYLENLHSYNQARLHQYSMLMSTNLKVVDTPFLPSKPLSGKRGMLIIAAFMGGMILVLAIVLFLEMTDNSIKTPLNAVNTTGLDLIGTFPAFPNKWDSYDESENHRIYEQSFGQLQQSIKLKLHEIAVTNQPQLVTIFSNQSEEGKSFIGAEVVNRFRKINKKVMYLCPDTDHMAFRQSGGKTDNYFYPVDDFLFDKKSATELVAHLQLDDSQYDLIVLELPPLFKNTYPVDLVKLSDVALLVTRANRTWKSADEKALKEFSKGLQSPPQLVLNGIRKEWLTDTLGELPKKETALDKVMKWWNKPGMMQTA